MTVLVTTEMSPVKQPEQSQQYVMWGTWEGLYLLEEEERNAANGDEELSRQDDIHLQQTVCRRDHLITEI